MLPQDQEEQFSKLNQTATVLLQLLLAWLQRQPCPASYTVHMDPRLGYHVFRSYQDKLKLHDRPDWSSYAQLLPADWFNTCDNVSPASDTSSALAAPTNCNSRATATPSASGKSNADDNPRPTNYDTVLTKLANSGLLEASDEQMCQEHWPTPPLLQWQETETMIAQLGAVLYWMDSKVQRSKRAQQDAHELWVTIMLLLHKLLLGHCMNLSLDMSTAFHATFPAVMLSWSTHASWQAKQVREYADPEAAAEAKWSPEYLRCAQLGRAMLRRLAADASLAQKVLGYGKKGRLPKCRHDGLMHSAMFIFELICEYLAAECSSLLAGSQHVGPSQVHACCVHSDPATATSSKRHITCIGMTTAVTVSMVVVSVVML